MYRLRLPVARSMRDGQSWRSRGASGCRPAVLDRRTRMNVAVQLEFKAERKEPRSLAKN
jgi:hypothetical protein